MILADSSIWIDHLRRPDPALAELMDNAWLLVHPFVIGEVALGHLREREKVLDLMTTFFEPVLPTHDEVIEVVYRHDLAGSGLGWVDVHLLASAMVTVDAALWTRDKTLARVAERLGVAADLG